MPHRRQVPTQDALLMGLSEEDVAIIQAALDYFDQGYQALMAHLKALGATQSVYFAVNRTIKLVMGKPRAAVSAWDPNELELWGDGYAHTLHNTQALDQAARAARDGFVQALREWGHEI